MSTKVSDEAYSVRLNDVFKLKVLESVRKKTAKGDPCVSMTLELFENPPVSVDGKEIDINGLKFFKTSTMTEKALKFFNIERAALGLPKLQSAVEYDSVNALDYKGMTGFAVINSEEVEKKNEVTGRPMTNPHTGKPLTEWNRNIEQWIPPEE